MWFLRKLRPFLLIAPLLVTLGAEAAAESKARSRVSQTPIPEWAEVSEVVLPESIPTDELENGIYYLALEHQVHVEEEAEFTRTVALVTTSEGTEYSSEIAVDFDPAFQSVEFHHIRIHRDGEVLDRFDPDLVRVLQREEDLESRILDGSLTAYYVVEDVRVGDILESTYTLRGRNPAFEGRYYDSFSIGWSVPLHRQLLRILSDPKRPIHSRAEGSDEQPERKMLPNGLVEIRWERNDPTPIHGDSDVPCFHTTYPWLQFSESADWQSVAKWVAGMYADNSELPVELETRIAAIDKREIATKRKVVALLQLVQEDIRYLGVEMGTGAYHPRSPAVVYKRRFGDCKDKTLLLHTLLSRIGVKSTPALVNSSNGRAIESWLPSPTNFDHVILAVDVNGSRYWVDPTRSNQRGPLEARGIPDYGFALLASPTETGLSPIECRDATRFDIAISEEFKTTGVEEPVELTVRTRYAGFAAEDTRSYFASNSRESIGKAYTEYYAEEYPDIALLRPVAFEDDAKANVCTTVEHYRIDRFWEREGGDDSESTVWTAGIYPSYISDQLERPSSSRRKTPFALRFPRRVTQDIEVNLWENWKDASSETEVADPAFRFSKWMKSQGSVVKIHHEYESLTDHVPADAIAVYHANIEKIRDSLKWTFTRDTAESAASPEPGFELSVPTLALSLGTVVATAIGGFGFSLVPRKRPPLVISPEAARSEGLGGWLLLFQIGLWLTPIAIAASLPQFLDWCFNGYEWTAMRSVVSEGQYPALQALLYGQFLLEIAIGLGSIFLLVHFYQRRFFVPTLCIVLLLAAILNAGLELSLATLRNDIASGVIAESRQALVRQIVIALIWAPYFLVSRRVKATFRF